ncbi:hypothetical protein [Komagataeibacter diospyri]|uniref:hypothetical protein n=1 Tax=Komagataeibacter diospyri TaxID=1932662 RepID=UPI0037577A25
MDTEVTELKKEVAALRARVKEHESLIERMMGLFEGQSEISAKHSSHINGIISSVEETTGLADFLACVMMLEIISINHLLKRLPYSSKEEVRKLLEKDPMKPTNEKYSKNFDAVLSLLLSSSKGTNIEYAKEILGHILPALRNIHFGH